MKTSNLVEILKKGNFVVPMYIFSLRDKLNLKLEEFDSELLKYPNFKNS